MKKLTRGIKLGDSGAEVKELQKILNAQGYAIVVDGCFGPLTQKAVIQYQLSRSDSFCRALAPDGIVGPATWSSLFGWDRDNFADGGKLGTETVRVAEKYLNLHVQETKDTDGWSNSGPYIDQWIELCHLDPPQPWCAAAVCGWIDEALKNLKINFVGPLTASASDLFDWFGENKLAQRFFAKDAVVCPGDVGFLFFPSLGRVAHAFVVQDIPGPGMITTIEGNSNEAGGREGYGIFKRFRPLQQVHGFGRINL